MAEEGVRRRDWLGLTFRALYRMRYISMVAVICAFAGSALMFVVGAVKTVTAIAYYLFNIDLGVELSTGAAKGDLTQKLLVQSVDSFLFAMVMMIFSFGVYNLFIKPTRRPAEHRPFWFNMQPDLGDADPADRDWLPRGGAQAPGSAARSRCDDRRVR